MSIPRLNPQDLMTLRDAAEELGDIDLAQDLNEVGDKLADLLKEELDTEQNALELTS